MCLMLRSCFPRRSYKPSTQRHTGCWSSFLTRFRMRTRSSSTQSEGNFLPGQGGSSEGGGGGGGGGRGGWLNGKFQKLFRRPGGQDSGNNTGNIPGNIPGNITSTDSPLLPSSPERPPSPEILQFDQILEQNRFSEASQQLIEREERLFGENPEAEGLQGHEEEVNSLAADYEALERLIVQTLKQSLSLNTGEVSAEALTSAVKAVYQEDEQDQLWKQRDGTPPSWRASGWRELHDKTVTRLIKDHMRNPSPPPADQVQQSSVEAHVCSMGRQLLADLQLVVGEVKTCYPTDVNICDFYARMFHQNISARLKKIADFGLEEKDCTFLLRWVNEYYPGLLQKPELAGDISIEPLGKLLSEELLKPLEEQYLSIKQTELMTYIRCVLEREEQKWKDGEEPKMEDGYYDSPVAYDIIQFIHGMVTLAEKVVGDLHKARSITSKLDTLMKSFKLFQDEVVKKNQSNGKAFIKANLGSVQQFTNVLQKNGHLFQEDVRIKCLSVLSDMKESAHTYLLSSVHVALKPHYGKLGTSDWLNKPEFERLLVSIQTQSEELQGSKESCHQELMCQFHQEVTVEYVKRLLKGRVKLKDKNQQDKACTTVKDDAESLHELFVKMGSKEDWLKEILTTIAEVLKLQELPAIQMQVASLGIAFPDLSNKHVAALLKLKTNISSADRKTVKETLSDALRETSGAGSRTFFSKVQVK
ncbi:tumor necrosis factor alpha-induced protein 2-like isoform X1 [Hippoglossus hippoglossus]|uniref:tumor necrosis factor alpha-induced protein 2-like isoform X1 n=2 Tax=Hippoglossus hippoglossus TaxID=8267 RepID=UPI00148E0F15|nr:tumor necrosis factor alpha-induced protein 2-like isoform X1 [Hippoglossus hippoglossus]